MAKQMFDDRPTHREKRMKRDDITNQEILITGGTGSLGTALTKLLKTNYKPKGIRIYSRSELNQFKMQEKLIKEDIGIENISFLIGDIRDKQRLEMACNKVDVIINCAAMKRIDTCDSNPLECINTNVLGVENIIYAALRNRVMDVFHISTDKAVYPTTLYGSSKKCAEDIIKYANTYSAKRTPRFSCARYGNVFGSNGSVIQIFKEQAKSGELTITDQQMTRFWITLEKVAQFIIDCINEMMGGEIFIPKMPTMSITDIAKTISPEATLIFTGIRGMEKLHECLLTTEESRLTIDEKNQYIITEHNQKHQQTWSYTSNMNDWQLTRDELRKMLEEL